jgi:ribonuclease Z
VNFSYTVLGSSSAIPTSKSYTSAHVVQHHGHYFLVDCGEGTQMRLRQFSIPFSRINHIFISHLHGDHFFGLPGLLTSFNLLNRKQALHIYAFPELSEILHLNNPRLIFGEQFGYKILIHPLCADMPERVLDSKTLTVTSVPMKHRIPCCGFIFEEKQAPGKLIKEKIDWYKIPVFKRRGIKEGNDLILDDGRVIPNNELTTPSLPARKICICSDTLYNKQIIPFIKNADLLFHEATFMHNLLARAKETCHSTAAQAAMIASEAMVKKLVIGHFSVRYKDIKPIEKEARALFPDTFAAEDGMRIDL